MNEETESIWIEYDIEINMRFSRVLPKLTCIKKELFSHLFIRRPGDINKRWKNHRHNQKSFLNETGKNLMGLLLGRLTKNLRLIFKKDTPGKRGGSAVKKHWLLFQKP